MAPKRTASSEGDPLKAKKARAELPLSWHLPVSMVNDDFLDSLHERGLVSNRSLVRASEGEAIPISWPNEVVVFTEQYECGLCFPCSDFLTSVLAYYGLEIQHVAPNSIVHLSTFEWAFQAEGVNPSACIFVHLHAASICKKFHTFVDVKIEICYGQIFICPRDHVVVLAKAYKDRGRPLGCPSGSTRPFWQTPT